MTDTSTTTVTDLVLIAHRLASLATDLGCEISAVQVLTYTEPSVLLHLRGNEPAVDTLATELLLGDPKPEPYANYDREGEFEGHRVEVYSGRSL